LNILERSRHGPTKKLGCLDGQPPRAVGSPFTRKISVLLAKLL
jgi:hypothetical protein